MPRLCRYIEASRRGMTWYQPLIAGGHMRVLARADTYAKEEWFLQLDCA